jgi:Protein of unknown function (DUF998)
MNAILTARSHTRSAGTDSVDRLLGAACLLGTAVMLAAMASLHVLRSDLDPITQVMSYYGPGPYGCVFTISLGAFGIGLVALAALLRRGLDSQQQSPVALSFVAIAAASALVVAIFNADLPNASHTLHGMLHGLGALFFWTAFPVAAIDLSSRLRQRAVTRAFGRLSLALGVLSLIELVLSLAISPLGGLLERALLATDAAWVVLVAVALSHRCEGAEIGRDDGTRRAA